MAEVVSKVTQLMSAYRTHYNNSKVDKADISHYLLLFYAVECGLKAQYLKGYNRKTTHDFTSLPINQQYGHGHDILRWMKELSIPASVIGNYKDNEAYSLKQLHERLRYGVFSPQLEKDQVVILNKVAELLNQSLNS